MKYEGGWRDGKMHGQGKCEWYGGWVYIGEYYKGKKHGFGQYSGKGDDGRKMKGDWVMGRVVG